MARRTRDEKTKDLFAYAEDNRASIVYMATNTVNGKRYIGITRRELRIRIYNHIGSMNGGSRTKFHNAMRKHGRDAFDFEIIEHCESYQHAKRAEQRLISEYCPEYNLTKGGDGVLGYRATAETRRKQSLVRTGKPSKLKGTKANPESVAKMRASKLANPTRYWLGKKRDQKTIDKMSTAKLGKPLSDKSRLANSARRKPVMCLTDGLAFETPQVASVYYGCSLATIARVCRSGGERPWKIKKQFVYAEEWWS